MPRNTFATRLRQMVAASGMNAGDLAEHAGLHRSHLYLILHGNRGSVGAETLSKLCDVLGVSMDWLYRGAGASPSGDDVRSHVEKVMRAPSKRKRTGTEG